MENVDIIAGLNSLGKELFTSIIRNDISTNAQTSKHNINNVCNLIKLKQAI
jgi:hypothetical protein